MSKTWHEEWQVIKKLHGKERWEHFWQYYKLPLFGILILSYFLGYGMYRYATRKDTVLFVAFINVSPGEIVLSELTVGFLKTIELNTDDFQIVTYKGLTLSDSDEIDRQYVYASEVKILAAINAKKLDVVIMDETARDIFTRNGYLTNLASATPWIDVSHSSMFNEFNGKVYMGGLKNSPRQENIQNYVRYLLMLGLKSKCNT